MSDADHRQPQLTHANLLEYLKVPDPGWLMSGRSTPHMLNRIHCQLKSADQLHVVRMPSAISDNVAAKIVTQKRKVAENVEDFVAGRFIGEAQAIVDGA